jgi:peptidoglycan-N-acetylglucosamine deacetylase
LRLLALSVDLDEIPNYFQIHGLPEPDGAMCNLVYDRALGRLEAFARDLEVPLTLFAIGADLSRAENARSLRRMHLAGHEIANHSLHHMYDFSQLSRAGIQAQIEGGVRAIQEAVGEAPRGFRAPGYTVTDEVFEVLAELGVLYDSSVFPCPAYYAAKVVALGMIQARGRESNSIVDHPNVLRAPTRPYRIGTPYFRTGLGMVELPIQVTRGPRLPVIGTSLALAGPVGAKLLARMCNGEPLINLELHGIDLLDSSDLGLEALRRHQPDVRIPWKRKLETFAAVVRYFKAEGYQATTLQKAAEAVLKSCPELPTRGPRLDESPRNSH